MDIEQLSAQALIDLPTSVQIKTKNGDEVVQIQAITLGKMQMLSNLFLDLEIDWEKMDTPSGVMEELLRVSGERTDTVAQILAVCLEDDARELRNPKVMEKRVQEIKDVNTYADFNKILLVVFEKLNPANFSFAMRLSKILNLNAPLPKKGNHIA